MNNYNFYEKSQKIFAVVDCNNFFVSCERVFNPGLKNKPVVVLSNNDGCAVSRSAEAKALGIPMGAPAFKYKELFRQHKVQLFSSNFILYGDISNRVMQIIREESPNITVYSIDEAFLNLTNLKQNMEKFCGDLRNRILKEVGIPVSIGIAHTKTLAKAANDIAKKHTEYNGVFSFANKDEDFLNIWLDKIHASDVWGVGRGYTKILNGLGIKTAYELKMQGSKWAKNHLKIIGERTVLELNNISCTTIRAAHDREKSIISSRSFGIPVKELKDLEEAVAKYVSIGAHKLRKINKSASFITVYLTTNYFRTEQKQYSNSFTYSLEIATSYTPDLISAGHHALRRIFKQGYIYKKAGIILTGLQNNNATQFNLLKNYDIILEKKKIQFIKTIDKINLTLGHNYIYTASEGIKKRWKMKSEQRSQQFTTKWDELITIKI